MTSQLGTVKWLTFFYSVVSLFYKEIKFSCAVQLGEETECVLVAVSSAKRSEQDLSSHVVFYPPPPTPPTILAVKIIFSSSKKCSQYLLKGSFFTCCLIVGKGGVQFVYC